MTIVGGRLYSISNSSKNPILLRIFDPSVVLQKLLEPKHGAELVVEENKHAYEELRTECYWAYCSPDESLICFYASKEYIVIFDTQSGDLRWCYRLHGKRVDGYWEQKPIFHPTRPMIAWVGQLGTDNREDFSSLKHCGVYMVDLSDPKALPVRFENLAGKTAKKEFQRISAFFKLTLIQSMAALTLFFLPAAHISTVESLVAMTTTMMNAR